MNYKKIFTNYRKITKFSLTYQKKQENFLKKLKVFKENIKYNKVFC